MLRKEGRTRYCIMFLHQIDLLRNFVSDPMNNPREKMPIRPGQVVETGLG